MIDYRIGMDDRGWPMAFEIRADGSVAVRAAGAFIGPRLVRLPVSVNGEWVIDAVVDVDWYHVGPEAGGTYLWPGAWHVASNAPGIARLVEADSDLALVIGGRASRGAWCGLNRVCGRTPFPFTSDEWDAVTGQTTKP